MNHDRRTGTLAKAKQCEAWYWRSCGGQAVSSTHRSIAPVARASSRVHHRGEPITTAVDLLTWLDVRR